MTITRTWLVTGASRGIGFSVVQQLLRSPEHIVFAACRNPTSAVALDALGNVTESLGKLHIVQMDVTDEASINHAASEVERILGSVGLDYLINNAGIAVKDDKPSTLDTKDLTTSITSNVGGPLLVTRALIPLIERGNRKVIANISTSLASIGIDFGSGLASYSISKTALNMLTYKQAKERPDLILFLIDPGWVKTNMGGQGAMLEPSESAAEIVNVVSNANQSFAGRFMNYKGDTVPW